MSIGLWSIFTAGIFDRPLAFNFQGAIKRVSLNNQPCKARPTLADINSNETLFYPFTVSVNKYRGSSNTIDNSYGPVCVLNKVKYMNEKVFNLMSEVNEIRFIVKHE